MKEEALRILIRMERPSVLLLHETKMQYLETKKLGEMQWKGSLGIVLCYREASSGLRTHWDNA